LYISDVVAFVLILHGKSVVKDSSLDLCELGNAAEFCRGKNSTEFENIKICNRRAQAKERFAVVWSCAVVL